jgi:hypothetical protein
MDVLFMYERMNSKNTIVKYASSLTDPTEARFQPIIHYLKSNITIICDPPELFNGDPIMSFCLSDDGENSLKDVRNSVGGRRSIGYVNEESAHVSSKVLTNSESDK